MTARAQTSEQAIRSMDRALREFRVRGVATNLQRAGVHIHFHAHDISGAGAGSARRSRLSAAADRRS